MWPWVESYFAALPAIDDVGGSGYYYIDPAGLIFGRPSFVTIHYFFDKTNTAAIDEVFAPLYKQAYSINGTSVFNITAALPLARYVYPVPYASDSTGANVLLGSRLYSKAFLKTPSGPAKYVAAFKNITALTPIPIYQGHLTAGGQVARNADVVDSALNPSWRRALGEFITLVGWEDTTPVETQTQYKDLLTNTLVPILAAVEPDMGAYTNEANAYEPHWQKVFWGYNYPRLWEVRQKWDPNGVFRCNRCVGSEKWDPATALNCPAS
jgi:Berberine and berberine like